MWVWEPKVWEYLAMPVGGCLEKNMIFRKNQMT
jgi:hypothetical protein